MTAPVEPTHVSDLLAWYCVRAQPKHEQVAAVHLRRQLGIEVFAPRIRFQQALQRRRRWITEAMFPGYLFARFDLTERGRAVQYSQGVSGILHFGKKYAAVPANIVEQLRQMVDQEDVAVVYLPNPERGQRIIIAEGPFRGWQTVITSYLPAKERVRVLMNMLGQDMEVEMPAGAVTPVKRAHPLEIKYGATESDLGHGE